MASRPPHAGAQDRDGLWAEAAAYARWTPSPHNIQPWRLHLEGDGTAGLYVDPARRLPNTDTTSAFTLMGMAMFAENLSAAVAPRGYRMDAEFACEPLNYRANAPQRIATLALRRDDAIDVAAATEHRELLLLRKTSRLPYDGTPVPDDVLHQLRALSLARGHSIAWSHNTGRVRQVLELNRDALFTDLDDDIGRTELRRWIRPTDHEAADTKDGLWAHCLRYPSWLMREFFDHHERWTRGANAALCKRLLMHGVRGTRTVAWWSGPFESPRDWIAAGQLLGAQWLQLAHVGIHMHPFGSVVTNPKAHATLLAQLGDDAPQQPLWLLARLGASSRPPRSYRLDASAIFLTDSELA